MFAAGQKHLLTCPARKCSKNTKQFSSYLGLRSGLCHERAMHAACRALRLVLFGFFGISASVGALIATTQVIASLGGAQRALPLADVAQSLGIDLAAAGTFAFFLRRDLQVRACAAMCMHALAWRGRDLSPQALVYVLHVMQTCRCHGLTSACHLRDI